MESKNVNWAIISNQALDGMLERRFRETHSLVWEYLMREFKPENVPGFPQEQLVFNATLIHFFNNGDYLEFLSYKNRRNI